MTYRIFASESELMKLSDADQYLFYNYQWKVADVYSADRLMLEFPEDQLQEAMAVHHELWKLRMPKLAKSWI